MLTNREGFKYFFGKVPEGTQRVLNENKVKLGKLKTIFLTGTISSWSEIGGLPGLFLTLSDSTKKSIDVFVNSSKLLTYILTTWRYFVFRKGVELTICDTNEEKLIADSNIAIKSIKIESALHMSQERPQSDTLFRQLKKVTSLMFPMDTSRVNSRDPDSYVHDPSETEIHTHVRLPEPTEVTNVSAQKSVNYLVRFLPMRGKFDAVKAKELGLKPGINFKLLSDGTPVQNEAGVTVYPEQVLLAPKLFPKMLILDIPNVSYLNNTVESQAWFQKNEDIGDEDIGIVYHFLGDEIDFKSDYYQKFIDKFPESCTHVISHSSIANNTLVFKRGAVNNLKLKCLQKDIFNLPHIENYNKLQGPELQFKLQQNQQFEVSTDGVKCDESLIKNETWSEIYDANIKNVDCDKNTIVNSQPITLTTKYETLKDNVQIVTLGTGSAIPSLYRNVISTLLRIPYDSANGITYKSILLDGGENTLGTMLRNFGHDNEKQFHQIFKELAFIHLSHLHADHHLGLVSVINKWFQINRNNDNKLYLVCPWQYDHFMNEWYKLEVQLNKDVDLARICYFSCEDFLDEKIRLPEIQQMELDNFETKYDNCSLTRSIPRRPLKQADSQSIQQMYKHLNIFKIETVRALHCAWAYSINISFTLDENETQFKVSYSGDTRPNPNFVHIGYGSDLLIHESSLDNDLIEEALAKKHSTMIEAVTVSRLMNCRKILLTHFSSRYSNSANIAVDVEELNQLTTQLKDYLTDSHYKPNIFKCLRETNQDIVRLEDLEICFAFDMMNIRLNSVNCQMNNFKQILQMFVSDEDVNDEKKEKELSKQREKREAKRNQRLQYKNKKFKQSP
jgi:ribonuclease Z